MLVTLSTLKVSATIVTNQISYSPKMSSSTKFRFYLIHFPLLCLFPFFLLDCGMIFGNVGLKKPRFSALPDQMATNFRKLGIQKSTVKHDIFN